MEDLMLSKVQAAEFEKEDKLMQKLKHNDATIM